MDVAQLRVHHRAQHAAPAMRRVDADDRHAAAREHRAGYRELERKRAGAADDLAVLERRVHALEREHLLEALDPLLRELGVEVLADPVEGAAVLVRIRL